MTQLNNHPDVLAALNAVFDGEAALGQLTPLQGDASSRQYFRFVLPDGRSHIVMLMAKQARSDEGPVGDALPIAPERPFVNMQRFLKNKGIRVPKIYPQTASERVLILEDLGDNSLFELLAQGESASQLYPRVIDLLAHMHAACAHIEVDCIAATRTFDAGLLRWELDHFLEWGHNALVGESAAVSATLGPVFDRLAERVAALPVGFVHRDFQSKNLMRTSDGQWCVIDFQDALRGPRSYDLVALLCDSYVSLDETFQREMIARYAMRCELPADEIEREFWLIAAQRKLKDAGRFIFIDREKHNPNFLQWFPQSLEYADRALSKINEGDVVREVLRDRLPGYPDQVRVPESKTRA